MKIIKLFFTLLASLMIMPLLGQQNYNLRIDVSIEDQTDTTAYQFIQVGDEKATVIAEKKVYGEESFRLDVRIEKAGYYELRESKNNYMIIITEPGEHIKIEADYDNFSRPKINGSPASEIFYTFLPRFMEHKNALDSLEDVYARLQQSESKIPQEQKDQLVSSYNYHQKQQKEKIRRLVKQNINKLTGLMFVDQLDVKKDFTLLNSYAEALNTKYPENEFVQAFYSNVKKEAKTATGEAAPEIALPTPQGDTLLLSELQGKIVLIDFWASWCKPCRDENPEMVRLYKKYKDQGYEVLGVSLDEKRESWLQAIKKDQLSWHHVSDLKGWRSSAGNTYNVKTIPYTVLVDRQGNIIAKGLRGEALKKKLKQLFED
ncbi:MAG: TlpA family protein disulfide reductase [Bacteroidota bacterium]